MASNSNNSNNNSNTIDSTSNATIASSNGSNANTDNNNYEENTSSSIDINSNTINSHDNNNYEENTSSSSSSSSSRSRSSSSGPPIPFMQFMQIVMRGNTTRAMAMPTPMPRPIPMLMPRTMPMLMPRTMPRTMPMAMPRMMTSPTAMPWTMPTPMPEAGRGDRLLRQQSQLAGLAAMHHERQSVDVGNIGDSHHVMGIPTVDPANHMARMGGGDAELIWVAPLEQQQHGAGDGMQPEAAQPERQRVIQPARRETLDQRRERSVHQILRLCESIQERLAEMTAQIEEHERKWAPSNAPALSPPEPDGDII